MKLKYYIEILFICIANPIVVIAQYNQHASYKPVGTDQAAFFGSAALGFLKFALGAVAVLAILRIIIACIIYLTHADDEDRNDTAWSWWRQSFAYLIVAQVVYFAAIKLGDYLNLA